jgi:hypothetical protein
MGLFTKSTPTEPTGTEQLRTLLIARIRRRSALAIAADINDLAAEKAGRELARTIAVNMAGPNASPVTLTSLANTTFASLPTPKVTVITEKALQGFADGADLSAEEKNWLVVSLLGAHKGFDAANDAIVLVNVPEVPPHRVPARWQHPDPVIREKLAQIERLNIEIRDAPLTAR